MPLGDRLLSFAARALLGCAITSTSIACAAPGRWTDYTSVSIGQTNGGRIHRPARMPRRGTGYEVPKAWHERGNQFGTDELIGAIERAAAKVRSQRRVTLGVADLSPLRGGKTPWHSSHQSGRDVDLIFYSVDDKGRSLPPPQVEMVAYDGDGQPFVPSNVAAKGGYQEPTWQQRRFDSARNWELVEALLSDPAIRVQWIFVSAPLEQRLLTWAERHDRPRWVIEYARAVMKQPSASAPHEDHFHVRVYCSRSDRELGCVDTGPIWQHEKKTYKYGGPERYEPSITEALLNRPLFFVRG